MNLEFVARSLRIPIEILQNALHQAKAQIQNAISGPIQFHVLGSSRRNLGLYDADIDIDLIVCEGSPFHPGKGLSFDQFQTFVQNIADLVVPTIDLNTVTRSFTFVVGDVNIEVFPKYRRITGTAALGPVCFFDHFRFARELAIPHVVDFIEYNAENMTNANHAIVILKRWKLDTGVVFKSYHLGLLARAEVTVTHPHVVPDGYFNLPAPHAEIQRWITCLWRRIVAVRVGRAALWNAGQQIGHIDYGGTFINAVPLLDFPWNVLVPGYNQGNYLQQNLGAAVTFRVPDRDED